ncbi:MAG: hypothetical protein JWM02_3358 [Frankiales bacterium]|nr:hypothetical protein [Frankiales bacterium]
MTPADLERFWMRRRAMSFDELCCRDVPTPRPSAK